MEGKSAEEIAVLLEEAKRAYFASLQNISDTPEAKPIEPASPAGESVPASQEHAPAKGAYQAQADLQYVVKQGSRMGYHFLLCLNSYADLKTTGLKLDWFRHRMSFQISADDSRELFANKSASGLPEHICQYYDTLNRYSFRPYLHPGICWDGWMVDEHGEAVNPFAPPNM